MLRAHAIELGCALDDEAEPCVFHEEHNEERDSSEDNTLAHLPFLPEELVRFLRAGISKSLPPSS
jgi:hypothetical protein